MPLSNPSILVLNGGSSSIKFALYEIAAPLTALFYGELENIGAKNSILHCTAAATAQKSSFPFNAMAHDQAASLLLDWLEKQEGFSLVKAIGHRIVHGMQHTAPEKITAALLADLKKISAYDPEHLPGEIELIALCQSRYPALTHVACFDTSFHHSMPPVAKRLPIPRRFDEKGIQRYGFHGLSYAYLVEELERVAGAEAAHGRIIMAHLGSGASLTALKAGKSMDTSMGFTPASGIPMGTRTGDLDPGVAWYFMQAEKLSPEAFSRLVNHESGLLGVSETSADMRALLKAAQTDYRAADAIDLFCYQAKKWIGSFAAVLGGVDTLVFSGGIGEHAPEIRKRICKDLGFLGIELEDAKNEQNDGIISSAKGRVSVHVIATNEELMIARLVCRVLDSPVQG